MASNVYTTRQPHRDGALQDFVIAFEKWENDYRVNPTNYYTPDETAGLEVSAVSVGRAEYFMDLLTENKE